MSFQILRFSPQQWRVLQALDHYRFLTVEQMLRLKISTNAKSLREKVLAVLRYHDCIRSEKIGSFLPDVHHLTVHGAEILSEGEGCEVPEPPSPKKQPFSPIFARHRFAQVDFQIGLDAWTTQRGDAEVSLALQDFVRRPEAVTRLQVPNDDRPIIPDGTFTVTLTNGATALYLVEIHRATQTRKVTKQLARYFEVISGQVAQQKYGLQAHPIICSVHENDTVLKATKQAVLQHPEFAPFQHNFVFRSMDGLNQNFTNGWHFADDHAANPFPASKTPPDAR